MSAERDTDVAVSDARRAPGCVAPTSVFPFVVGCGRSGTTLLRSFLDAHPELAVPGESHFLGTIARARGRYERASGFDRDRFCRDVTGHERFARWGIDPTATTDAICAARPPDIAAATEVLYRTYAASEGKSRWADKTPDYVTRMPRILDMIPTGRFIHVIRDGRAVAASLAAQSWGPSTVRSAAHHWATRVARGRRDGQALGAARYQEVRYEALVADPETVLREICAFISLDYDERMLDRGEAAERAMRQVVSTESHGALTAGVAEGGSLQGWDALSDPQQRVVLDTAGHLLDELGYVSGEGTRRARLGARVGAAAGAARVVPARVRIARRLVF